MTSNISRLARNSLSLCARKYSHTRHTLERTHLRQDASGHNVQLDLSNNVELVCVIALGIL
jgi:hypothetical protein